MFLPPRESPTTTPIPLPSIRSQSSQLLARFTTEVLTPHHSVRADDDRRTPLCEAKFEASVVQGHFLCGPVSTKHTDHLELTEKKSHGKNQHQKYRVRWREAHLKDENGLSPEARPEQHYQILEGDLWQIVAFLDRIPTAAFRLHRRSVCHIAWGLAMVRMLGMRSTRLMSMLSRFGIVMVGALSMTLMVENTSCCVLSVS